MHIEHRGNVIVQLGIAVLVLFAGFFNIAQADYMDYHFELRCDPENNRAELVPYAVENKSVHSNTPQDCVFSNGRSIRAKMELVITNPYGMGGADPSKWLNLWIDKVQILNRTEFYCRDEGSCSIRVIVTAKGLNVCHREPADALQQRLEVEIHNFEVLFENTQQESSHTPEEKCEFTPNDKLSSTRDLIEFPLSNERKAIEDRPQF